MVEDRPAPHRADPFEPRRRSTRTLASRGDDGGSPTRSGAPRREPAAAAEARDRAGRGGSDRDRPGTKISSSRFASATTASPREVARRVDRLERGRELPLAAVDHDEVRDRAEALVARRHRPAAAEPTSDDLGHRGEVVLSVLAADGERTVVRVRGWASTKTAIEATISRPCMFEMSKHSIRSGRLSRLSALAELLERLDAPPPPLLGRRASCASASCAFSPASTASRSFSPRAGARTSTRPHARSERNAASASVSVMSGGTITWGGTPGAAP